ncbi:MAG: MmcB family DNA repair protein [Pseudomonadota bacterium]
MALLREDVFSDPRLSPEAIDVVRGVVRLMTDFGFACVTELVLANRRRADVCAIGPRGEITIVEVKSGLADFRADHKWPDYQPFCDRFFFAVDQTFPQDLIPEEAGLIVADPFGGAILRDPVETPLAAARRKAVTLRFVHAAAGRLMRRDARGASA